MNKSLCALIIPLLFLLHCHKEPEAVPEKIKTFRMFTAEGGGVNWNTESLVARVVAEKTGVTIDLYPPKQSLETEMLLMLADKTYPDIIYAKGFQNRFVDTGIFIPLDDLIEKHGPNIKKFYGEDLKRLRYSAANPSIYFLGSFPIKDQNWDFRGVFMLQLEVVETLGYPRLRTLKDFEEAVKKYKTVYPEINGEPAIGISIVADDWRFNISVTNPAFWATGAPDDGEWYVEPGTYNAILHHRRPEEKEYFRWLNHLNSTGILDPESFIQSYEQYRKKISSGRVLGLIDARWDIQGAESELWQKGMSNRIYGSFPLSLSEEYTPAGPYPAVYFSRWGIGITDKCVDPVAVIKYFDYLLSEEGQILTHWGIEGIHYSLDKEGMRFFTQAQADLRNNSRLGSQQGVYMYKYPFPEYGRGVLDSTGQVFVPIWREDLLTSYTPLEQRVLKAYGAEYWRDIYPPEETFPVRPYGVGWQIDLPSQSDVQFIFDRCQEVIRKRITEAILSNPGAFDSTWNNMQAELIDAGAEKLEAAVTKIIRERIALWQD